MPVVITCGHLSPSDLFTALAAKDKLRRGCEPSAPPDPTCSRTKLATDACASLYFFIYFTLLYFYFTSLYFFIHFFPNSVYLCFSVCPYFHSLPSFNSRYLSFSLFTSTLPDLPYLTLLYFTSTHFYFHSTIKTSVQDCILVGDKKAPLHRTLLILSYILLLLHFTSSFYLPLLHFTCLDDSLYFCLFLLSLTSSLYFTLLLFSLMLLYFMLLHFTFMLLT